MSQFRLARTSLILAAALGLNTAPALLTSAFAQDKPAAAAPTETVRPELFKLLDPARAAPLLAAKKYDDVQADITAAAAIPNLTPFEVYIINRARLELGLATKNDALTTPALEAIIATNRLPAADQAKFIDALGATYFEQKNYAKSVEWFKRSKKESATPDKGNRGLSQAYYMSQDFANAKSEAEKLIADAEAAHQVPTHADLTLLADVDARLKDMTDYALVVEKLVAYYPTEAYWADMVRRIQVKPGFRAALRQDVLRLLSNVVKAMKADEYISIAEISILDGFSAEAKSTLDAGYAAGVLGKGPDAAKQKQLLDKAAKGTADDAKNITTGDASARAAKTGQPMVNLGYAYVTMGQFDKGIELIEKGIAKGGLKNADDGKLRLGESLAKAGRKADAIKVFEGLKGNDGSGDLARYWIMFLKGPAAPAAAK